MQMMVAQCARLNDLQTRAPFATSKEQPAPKEPASKPDVIMNVVERVIIPKEIDGVLEFGAKWPLQKLPLRCADGDFTCVHGESHNVLRAITLKGQVCSCKPISVVQENNVLLSDDFEYGLCEGAHAGFGRSAHAHLALKPRVCRPRARSRAGGLRTLPRLARAARKVVGS